MRGNYLTKRIASPSFSQDVCVCVMYTVHIISVPPERYNNDDDDDDDDDLSAFDRLPTLASLPVSRHLHSAKTPSSSRGRHRACNYMHEVET